MKHEEFLRDLIKRYSGYWGNFPSWYAPIENLYNVDSKEAREIYEKIKASLRRLGKIVREREYSFEAIVKLDGKVLHIRAYEGGLDPKRRYWIDIKVTK